MIESSSWQRNHPQGPESDPGPGDECRPRRRSWPRHSLIHEGEDKGSVCGQFFERKWKRMLSQRFNKNVLVLWVIATIHKFLLFSLCRDEVMPCTPRARAEHVGCLAAACAHAPDGAGGGMCPVPFGCLPRRRPGANAHTHTTELRNGPPQGCVGTAPCNGASPSESGGGRQSERCALADSTPCHCLSRAACGGPAAAVRRADINATDESFSRTALHNAAIRGHHAVAQLLLSAGRTSR